MIKTKWTDCCIDVSELMIDWIDQHGLSFAVATASITFNSKGKVNHCTFMSIDHNQFGACNDIEERYPVIVEYARRRCRTEEEAEAECVRQCRRIVQDDATLKSLMTKDDETQERW